MKTAAGHLAFAVAEVRYRHAMLATRFPFRYGMASMEQAPHVFAEVRVQAGGREWLGVAAETLVPKWFVKQAGTSHGDDVEDMGEVLRHAARMACGGWTSYAEWWRRLYGAQRGMVSLPRFPALLVQMGTALLERAVLHALGQSCGQSLGGMLRSGLLGLQPASMRPDGPRGRWEDFLADPWPERMVLRHTVGLSDPLTAGDVEKPVGDGLPHTLEENVRVYGLTHFKIKLSGRRGDDALRLREIASLLPAGSCFTLDANENYPDFRVFREHWEGWMADPMLGKWMERGLLFVEQPLAREGSLDDAAGEALSAWYRHPPVIIDEADAALDDLPRALRLGYAGSSHKNCKGIGKGLANLVLLRSGGGILSGEDLSNIPPVALLQDLAVMAELGIPHVERNGHQYFRGSSMFPRRVADELVRSYPRLFRDAGDHGAVLRVERGQLVLADLAGKPMGLASEPLPGGLVDGLP
jgi:hypothetical protein